MIEIVCDGMNSTKSYTREVGDVKVATQVVKRHINNDPDHWVVLRDDKMSYMIMQEGDSNYGIYEMAMGMRELTVADLSEAVTVCWKYLTKK